MKMTEYDNAMQALLDVCARATDPCTPELYQELLAACRRLLAEEMLVPMRAPFFEVEST